MIKETVTMSHKELHRLQIIQESINRHITQEQAAARIGISIRQVKRLVQRYRNEGPSGLVSHRRGKRPNNSFSTEFRATVISLLKGRYADFGPTFACEKLREIHGLSLSVETLRKWMIEEGLWRERRRKIARIYQRRMRRPSYGELIQIDGSPHDWFENRGPRCTLIVFIDDATSALMALRFVPAETTRAYMETLRGYLNDHGVPLALYSDRHSIFRVNNPEREGELTQFTRAIKTLGIEPIHANSPQAKGRVERANLEAYNNRFATSPRTTDNAHLDVHHSEEELGYIFSLQAKRVLSKNLTFQYKSSAFQVRSEGRGYRLRHSVVTVCENFDGEINVLYDGKALGWEKYVDGPEPIPLDDEKSVHERVDNARIDLRSKYYVKSKADHPWLTRRTQSHQQVKPPKLPKKKPDPDKID
ncbi:ISNCY family transposase [Escherichia coli]|nr:ISNCY family transposase [Escherichia coli]EIS9192380.1 ISNCY family transposase [Escherichia coli]